MNQNQRPYLEEVVTTVVRKYNICKCGHFYYRHFDSYDNMHACGCKYCDCYEFVEDQREEPTQQTQTTSSTQTVYKVLRHGTYTLNSGDTCPGWQSHYIKATSPKEAKELALPIMNHHPSFKPDDNDAEVFLAQCSKHPRYNMTNQPNNTCGVCHAMWDASRGITYD